MTTVYTNSRVETLARPGLTLWIRPVLLDESVIDEVIHRDCYRLANVDLRNKTIIDCGAHVGVFSTMCAQNGATVYAYEPQPENLELLRLNAVPWPRITITAKAVGGTADRTWIMGESGGAHTGPDGVPVEQTTLADILDTHHGIDVLKLDMEGGEVDALLACDHDRLAHVQQIMLETHGPKICPWVEHAHVGEVVEHLLPTHNIEASGFPTHLGLIFASRNGCRNGW